MSNLEHLESEPRFDFELHDICHPFDFGKVAYVFDFASRQPVDYMTHAVETLKVGWLGVFNALDVAAIQRKIPDLIPSECLRRPAGASQRESYWGHVNPIGPRSCTTRRSALPKLQPWRIPAITR